MNVTISSRSNTAAGKGCATALFGVFAIMGLAFLVFIAKAGWDTVRAYSWTKTDCVIESSAMREKGDDTEFVVRYSYRFAGRNYTGTRFTAGMSPSMNAVSAQRAVQRYAAGRPAYCYVNASAPEESVLERSSLWMLCFGLIPLTFLVIGVAGVTGVWRAKPATPKAVSERHRGGKHAVLGLRIFGLFFMLIGGGVLYGAFFRPMLREAAAAKWPVVPCEIISSRVGRHSGSKGGYTYSVDVRYRYKVGGREYLGTGYNFDTGSSSMRDWRDEAVASLPPGAQTVCHVNPEDALDAVLSIRPSPDRWFGLIPGVFLVVGLLIVFKAPAMGRRRSVIPLGLTGSGDGLPSLPRGGATGETELKQATPPGCAFAGLTFFALLWNGIVWAILLNLGSRETGARIFLGIFALIGLAIAAGAVYQFLALFNPRPVLTVSAPAVPLGGSLDVRWRFTGNVRRLVKLTISLTAREEATYRRGTTTTTDKSVFVNTALLDTADRAQMSGGSMKVSIPRDLIHTFTAPNNKVVWLLHVRGDIPKWPDVNADFPIAVLPRDASTLFQEQPPAP
ncbi:MAG: DUF3592 domain-containing protein [Chthoniobacteraceae bacterium]